MTSTLALITLLTAAGQVELFTDRDETYVRAGTAEGLKVGSTVTVLGEPIGDTTARRRVGKATVLEVWEHLARVKLDEAATRAKEARFVEVDAQARPAPSAAPTSTTGGGAALKGRASLSGGVLRFRKVTIYNDSGRDWSTCEARFPNNLRQVIPRLKAGDQETLGMMKFKQDGVERDVPLDHIVVKCNEGTGRFGFPRD